MRSARFTIWAAVGVVAVLGTAALLLRSPSHEDRSPRQIQRVELSVQVEDEAGDEPPQAAAEAEASPWVTAAKTRETQAEPAPDEPAIMAELRGLMFAEPATSLQIARDGNARFPDGQHAAERAWFEVRVLVLLGRFDDARDVARTMVRRYPDTGWANDVRRHLLSHPAG